MRSTLRWTSVALALIVALLTGPAAVKTVETQEIPPAASLAAVAVLPTDTFAAGPPAGQFRLNGVRGEAFDSQPVQGVSSMRPDPSAPGWWFCLSDNGFGVRLNSSDYLLRIYRLRPDWRTPSGGSGGVDIGGFLQLSDPGRFVPFPIVREETPERWLTGGDFDPESFVLASDGSWWIGDEFGPFLLHVDAEGRLLAPPFRVDGLRTPDTPGTAPPDAGQPSVANVRRSRGFEGLAIDAAGRRLFAMLEGPTLADPPLESSILEFDLDGGRFTGRAWRYPLEASDHAATELVAYGPGRFLVIERDNGHGPAARFKRVFAIGLGEAGTPAVKHEVVDLLHLADPYRLGGSGARFHFPFITTEAVWPGKDDVLVLANDNNYPATGGRTTGVRDATEFIQLRLAKPLPLF